MDRNPGPACAGIAARHEPELWPGISRNTQRPTAHDNAAGPGNAANVGGPYDLQASHAGLGRFVGEVFCVSQALWQQKMRDTRAKLAKSDAPIRAIFYNCEAKPSYRPKMDRLVVFGIAAPAFDLLEVASTCPAWNNFTRSAEVRLRDESGMPPAR